MTDINNFLYLRSNNSNQTAMKNKNFIKIKRVNEERYFSSIYDVYRFVEKMTGTTMEHMCDMSSVIPAYMNNILIPMSEINKTDFQFMSFSGFNYLLTKGNYYRGDKHYIFNILSLERK